MKWSANIAYIVGLITTDGNLSKDGRHINITSKDEEQINNFKNILKISNKVSLKKGSYNSSKSYFFLQFGDVRFYRFLVGIGLEPNKTKTIGELKIPDRYFADFLRGYLDGDGYTYSYWDKRWKNSFMLYLGFSSASKKHLIWLKNSIYKQYKVQGRIKFNGRATYQLVYAKYGSLVLVDKMYYKPGVVCLSRKRFKIETALGIIRGRAGMLEQVDRHA